MNNARPAAGKPRIGESSFDSFRRDAQLLRNF